MEACLLLGGPGSPCSPGLLAAPSVVARTCGSPWCCPRPAGGHTVSFQAYPKDLMSATFKIVDGRAISRIDIELYIVMMQ